MWKTEYESKLFRLEKATYSYCIYFKPQKIIRIYKRAYLEKELWELTRNEENFDKVLANFF